MLLRDLREKHCRVLEESHKPHEIHKSPEAPDRSEKRELPTEAGDALGREFEEKVEGGEKLPRPEHLGASSSVDNEQIDSRDTQLVHANRAQVAMRSKRNCSSVPSGIVDVLGLH